jgi:hypothetical protein
MHDPHRDDSPPDDSLLLGLVDARAANRDALDEVDPGATDELPASLATSMIELATILQAIDAVAVCAILSLGWRVALSVRGRRK